MNWDFRDIISKTNKEHFIIHKCAIDCEHCLNVQNTPLQIDKEQFIIEYLHHDFSLYYGNFNDVVNHKVSFNHTEKSPRFIFQLEGNRLIAAPRYNQILEAGYGYIFANANGSGNMKFDKTQKFIDIQFSSSFLNKYVAEDYFIQYCNNDSSFLEQEPIKIPIGQEIIQLLQNLLSSDPNYQLFQIYIEATIRNLLLHALEKFMHYNHSDVKSAIQTKHYSKIIEAKAIIENNINTPCSLIDLAHQVGTNEFTLKKGFKSILGNTVIGYWTNLRLEKARKLLLETDLPINTVAFECGYSSPQHFSKVFKKKFNTTPKKLREKE